MSQQVIPDEQNRTSKQFSLTDQKRIDEKLEGLVSASPGFSGILKKRGFYWRKLWKKRWVELHGAEIAYMEEEPTNKSQIKIIHKSQITPAMVIDNDDIDGHPYGFVIHVNNGKTPSWYLRANSIQEKNIWLAHLNKTQAMIKWLDEFERVRVLGVGGTGTVYELRHKINGYQYALKEVEVTTSAQLRAAKSEACVALDVMEKIMHPNILNMDKVFQIGSKFYFVFPLCSGGDLFDRVTLRGRFTDKEAALFVRELISGIHALHQYNILHLDIKPENILYESTSANSKIKITDFGLSKVYHDTIQDRKQEPTIRELEDRTNALIESGTLPSHDGLRGTVGYMSPELVLMGVYSKSVDVWAAGVVLYVVLAGYTPFPSKNKREAFESTAKGEYHPMAGGVWDTVSEGAKDLVRRMLTVDPVRRISTAEILAHPWILAATSASSRSSSTSLSDIPLIVGRDSDDIGDAKCKTSYHDGTLRKFSSDHAVAVGLSSSSSVFKTNIFLCSDIGIPLDGESSLFSKLHTHSGLNCVKFPPRTIKPNFIRAKTLSIDSRRQKHKSNSNSSGLHIEWLQTGISVFWEVWMTLNNCKALYPCLDWVGDRFENTFIITRTGPKQ